MPPPAREPGDVRYCPLIPTVAVARVRDFTVHRLEEDDDGTELPVSIIHDKIGPTMTERDLFAIAGGGDYYVQAKDEKGDWLGRRKIPIAGEPKEPESGGRRRDDGASVMDLLRDQLADSRRQSERLETELRELRRPQADPTMTTMLQGMFSQNSTLLAGLVNGGAGRQNDTLVETLRGTVDRLNAQLLEAERRHTLEITRAHDQRQDEVRKLDAEWRDRYNRELERVNKQLDAAEDRVNKLEDKLSDARDEKSKLMAEASGGSETIEMAKLLMPRLDTLMTRKLPPELQKAAERIKEFEAMAPAVRKLAAAAEALEKQGVRLESLDLGGTAPASPDPSPVPAANGAATAAAEGDPDDAVAMPG